MIIINDDISYSFDFRGCEQADFIIYTVNAINGSNGASGIIDGVNDGRNVYMFSLVFQ